MIVSLKKHVRVFQKTCTTFSKNTYVFFPMLVRLKIQIYYRNFAVEL